MNEYSRIWLSTPHLSGQEMEYIRLALDKNWVAPLGDNIIQFENLLQNFLNDSKYSVALTSGTAAIHLSLIMLGVKSEDYVISQSLTFTASANPIKYLGANPIFVDSESDSWNMCPYALEKAIKYSISLNKKPKAVVCVHLYGMPGNLDDISSICDKYDIPLIEDAAEALGSTYKGRKCGSFGYYSIFSFNGNKIITTSGGGALICNSTKEKDRAIFLATQAKDYTSDNHYQHSEIGYNYRLSNISAGIGRGQMEVLDQHISLRRKMNAFYQELFKDIDGISVFKEPNDDYFSNHWLSAILVDSTKTKNHINREDIRLAFEADNIESRPLWKPMHLQPVFKDALYFGGTVAEDLFKDGLCLPSGSNLTDEDRERIAQVIHKLFK